MADHWVPTIGVRGQHDPRSWRTNWEEWLHPDEERSFERFIELLKAEYSQYTPEFAAKECRIHSRLAR